MDLQILVFAVVIFFYALKPGPGVVFFTSLAISEGPGSALLTGIGSDVGHFVIAFLLLAGLQAVHLDTRLVLCAQLFAATYIGVLGLRAVLGSQLRLVKPVSRTLSTPAKLLRGLAWPVSNPNNLAFYAAVFPTLVKLRDGDYLLAALYSFVAALSYFVAQLFLVTFADWVYSTFKESLKDRPLFKVSGGIMIILALYVIFSALHDHGYV